MSTFAASILSLSGPTAYLLVALLAAGEAAAFIGLVLPGEAALILGGVLASQGHASLPVMIAVAIVAAIVGDSIGYEVGRRFGPSLERSRLGRKIGPARWAKAEQFLVGHGGAAVLLGRWVGLLRALVPTVAGIGRMPYRSFLPWNAAGGTLWASTVVLLGYAAGGQYRRVEQLFRQGTWGMAGLMMVLSAALLTRTLIARRRRRGEQITAPAEPARAERAPTCL